ncbi:hypothetical protein ACQGAO_30405 [Rhodococcus sp. 1.20]
MNERYHWALQLSELITEHRSIEHRIGNVVVRGFVLDMWKVFEDFLMTTTAAAIASRGGTGVRPGSGATRYLDHGLPTQRLTYHRAGLTGDRGGLVPP